MAVLDDLFALRVRFLTDMKANVLFERAFTDKLKDIVGTDVLPPGQTGTVNVADVSNYVSARIGWEWANRLPGSFHPKAIKGQTAAIASRPKFDGFFKTASMCVKTFGKRTGNT